MTWTLIAICYIILSQVSSVSDEEVRAGYSDIDVRNLGYATACLYALQPCPIAILWIILYGGPIKVKFRSILGYGKKKTGGAHDEENIDDLSPQLNEALREEIVEYLKFGFDALFNTEFEKTRDPHKDQITIHIDPSEALRDDDDDDVDSKRNSVTSQMSNWWSGKDHHHHHHHHTNSTSSTPVSTTTTTTMNAAKMVCLVFHSFFFLTTCSTHTKYNIQNFRHIIQHQHCRYIVTLCINLPKHPIYLVAFPMILLQNPRVLK